MITEDVIDDHEDVWQVKMFHVEIVKSKFNKTERNFNENERRESLKAA